MFLKRMTWLALLVIVLNACNLTSRPQATAIPLAFGDDYYVYLNKKVVIEGRIDQLYYYAGCGDYCIFDFYPLGSTRVDKPLIIEVKETTEFGNPNRVLRTTYENGNTGFTFFTSDGQALTSQATLRVTGFLQYYGSSGLHIKVIAIEPVK